MLSTARSEERRVGKECRSTRYIGDWSSDVCSSDLIFLYEDALRQNNSIVLFMAASEEREEPIRKIMTEMRAESIDAARERWWIGLRSAETEQYTENNAIYRQIGRASCRERV